MELTSSGGIIRGFLTAFREVEEMVMVAFWEGDCPFSIRTLYRSFASLPRSFRMAVRSKSTYCSSKISLYHRLGSSSVSCLFSKDTALMGSKIVA